MKKVLSLFFISAFVLFAAPPAIVLSQSAQTPVLTPAPKVIYLTLDADMNGAMAKKYQEKKVKLWYDPKIIEYLQQNNIPTTFFVSGLFAEVYPDFIKSLANNPLFTIQNHSYDESGFTPHCYWLKPLSTPQEKTDQIKKTQDIIKNLTGKQPTLFRYPGLCRGKDDDKLVEALNLQINEGNIFASDPFNHSADKITANVLRRLKNNGVIVMHIGGPNAPASLEALKQIIPKILEQGFSFGSLQ